MKIFVLLFFSSFLYAQEPNSNADNSTQQDNTQGEVQTPPKSTAPDTSQEMQEKKPKQDPEATQESPQKDQKSDSAKEQTPAENNKDTAKESKSSATKLINNPQTVAVPPQPMEAPPEEPIPYYNPLHPQSSSTYQEGDLPSKGFSDMTASKNRKHRFSIGGKLFDYHVQGDQKEININALVDYGYSRKYFEVGPYASMEVHDFDVDSDRFQDKFMLDIGAFFEVNFMANANNAKNIPSIGLKAGYKRKQNMNYLVGQPYVTMKFFLNPQTAFFASLAPYFQYKLEGQNWEWGVEVPAGLRFYFY